MTMDRRDNQRSPTPATTKRSSLDTESVRLGPRHSDGLCRGGVASFQRRFFSWSSSTGSAVRGTLQNFALL